VPGQLGAQRLLPDDVAERTHVLLVSNRPGGCGGADIYTSDLRTDGTFSDPENLGCTVNSAADEQSPFPVPSNGGGPVLYFSSFRAGGFAPDADGAVAGDSDIYLSEWHGGRYQGSQLVAGVNTAADDAQPNVRRDGLEIVFYSTRTGTPGGPDIYAATRTRNSSVWNAPVNLGSAVNSMAGESRPSLTWDGLTLYFGSTRLRGDGTTDSDIAPKRDPLTRGTARRLMERRQPSSYSVSEVALTVLCRRRGCRRSSWNRASTRLFRRTHSPVSPTGWSRASSGRRHLGPELPGARPPPHDLPLRGGRHGGRARGVSGCGYGF
jgi:hypothetical protein